jgi:hypothetical protein
MLYERFHHKRINLYQDFCFVFQIKRLLYYELPDKIIIIFKMIFLLLVLTVTATDSFDATYKLTELQTNNGWLYLTSFHFKPHLAKV